MHILRCIRSIDRVIMMDKPLIGSNNKVGPLCTFIPCARSSKRSTAQLLFPWLLPPVDMFRNLIDGPGGGEEEVSGTGAKVRTAPNWACTHPDLPRPMRQCAAQETKNEMKWGKVTPSCLGTCRYLQSNSTVLCRVPVPVYLLYLLYPIQVRVLLWI